MADKQNKEFRGPGDWRAQARKVEKPNPVFLPKGKRPQDQGSQQAGGQKRPR